MSKKVLLVEDDPFWRKFCTIKFREAGQLEVISVPTASGAWETLKTCRPAVILLDLVLPGQDGFTFLEQIKKVQDLSAIPVIIVSCLSQEADVKQCFKLGAAAFFDKNKVKLETLIDEVKNHL